MSQNTPMNSEYFRSFFFFLIGIVVIVSYQNILEGPFLFDDYGNIVGNDHIYLSSLTLTNINEVFSPNQNSANRKIANLSFALNYYFGQLNPVGFHFINILIHIVNGWLIFCLFQWYFKRICLGSQWHVVILSGVASLWWVTNPIQTNAVTYIVQRMTSLSTMFCLAALLFYLKAKSITGSKPLLFSVSNQSIFFYIASSTSWVLALLSKEMAAIFPLLIIIHEVYFFDLYARFKTKQKRYTLFLLFILALLVIEIFYFLGPYFWERILQGYSHRDFSLLERLLTEPRVVFHYISLFLYPLPTRLHLYYDTYQISHSLFSPPTTAFAITGTLLWLAAIIIFFKTNRLLSFGLLWTFLCLIIESTVINLELVFEHRFYMPSFGFILALTAIFVWMTQRTNIRPFFVYGFMSIIIFSQILGTSTRNRVWANELEFSLYEIQKNPDSVRALSNLGVILVREGRPTVAEPYLQKALRIDPDNIVTLHSVFTIFNNPPYSNHIVAESYMQRVLALVKNGQAKSTDSYVLLGLSHHLFKTERYLDSMLLLDQVVKSYGAPEVYLHIGQCNLKLERYSQAQTALEHALRLEPHNPEFKFYYAWSHQLNKSPAIALKTLNDIDIDEVHDLQLKNNINNLLEDLSNGATHN